MSRPPHQERAQLQAHLPCPYLFPSPSSSPGGAAFLDSVLSSPTTVARACYLMIPLGGAASASQRGPPVLNVLQAPYKGPFINPLTPSRSLPISSQLNFPKRYPPLPPVSSPPTVLGSLPRGLHSDHQCPVYIRGMFLDLLPHLASDIPQPTPCPWVHSQMPDDPFSYFSLSLIFMLLSPAMRV